MSDVASVESSVPATQEWEETPDLFGAYPRLTEDQIATLLPGGSRRRVRVDEVLTREAMRSDELFVVLSGKVAIVTDDESGERRVLRVHGAGRFLGSSVIWKASQRSTPRSSWSRARCWRFPPVACVLWSPTTKF